MKRIQLSILLIVIAAVSSLQAAKCRVNTTPMDFGVYYPMQKNRLDITGSIELDCRGTRGTYTISASTGQSGNYLTRTMENGNNLLRYNLFTNASRTIIWGDGSANTEVFSGLHVRGRTRETLNIHGYVHANQDADPGLYNDFITVTIEF